jgi:FtsX extracellular domain
MPLLLLAACHSQPTPADLPRVSWQKIDTVLSYHLVRGGDQRYHRGDLLGLELVGGIDKKKQVFVPLDPADSGFAVLVTKIASKLLNESLDGKVGKNAEGYIKADLARLFPTQTVVITAYLNAGADSVGLDSLRRYIDRQPETRQQYYISKDEAKKRFLADGNPDFTAALNDNPLPASIEITVREAFVSKDTLLALKQKLESDQPLLISEVRLPSRLYTDLRKVKVQDCVFRFKT